MCGIECTWSWPVAILYPTLFRFFFWQIWCETGSTLRDPQPAVLYSLTVHFCSRFWFLASAFCVESGFQPRELTPVQGGGQPAAFFPVGLSCSCAASLAMVSPVLPGGTFTPAASAQARPPFSSCDHGLVVSSLLSPHQSGPRQFKSHRNFDSPSAPTILASWKFLSFWFGENLQINYHKLNNTLN